MNKQLTTILTVGIFLCLLAGSFIGGYRLYPRRNPCPEIVSDTVYVHDTVWHIIPDTVPYYIVKNDTVIVNHNIPTVVDTVAILADYYNYHYFTRTWEDSLLTVTLEDVISENFPSDSYFTYKILQPQTVITNVVNNTTYNRYLYFGIDLPIKNVNYIEIEGMFAFEKGYIGVGYEPQINSINLKAGVKLFKFKNDVRLKELYFMVEELRISLFSQPMKTKMPISATRLQKVWTQLAIG